MEIKRREEIQRGERNARGTKKKTECGRGKHLHIMREGKKPHFGRRRMAF